MKNLFAIVFQNLCEILFRWIAACQHLLQMYRRILRISQNPGPCAGFFRIVRKTGRCIGRSIAALSVRLSACRLSGCLFHFLMPLHEILQRLPDRALSLRLRRNFQARRMEIIFIRKIASRSFHSLLAGFVAGIIMRQRLHRFPVVSPDSCEHLVIPRRHPDRDIFKGKFFRSVEGRRLEFIGLHPCPVMHGGEICPAAVLELRIQLFKDQHELVVQRAFSVDPRAGYFFNVSEAALPYSLLFFRVMHDIPDILRHLDPYVLFFLCRRQSVQNKNIESRRVWKTAVLLQKRHVGAEIRRVQNPAEGVHILKFSLSVQPPLQKHIMIRQLLHMADKFFVVPAFHPDIDVVVPGNKAPVPHGAEQRPVGRVPGCADFIAEPAEFLQNHHLRGPFPLHHAADIEAFSHLVLKKIVRKMHVLLFSLHRFYPAFSV